MNAHRPSSDEEDGRCRYLHALFGQVQARIAAGEKPAVALTWAARRRRLRFFRRGRLSRSRYWALWNYWKRNPSPAIFRRNYRGPARSVPADLLLDLLNRLNGPRIISVAAALREIRVSWEKNEIVPGVGRWVDYARRHGGDKAAMRVTPLRFPFSRSIIYAYLRGNSGGEFQRRLTAARRAQRDQEDFSAYINSRKRALEKTLQHKPIANSSSPQ